MIISTHITRYGKLIPVSELSYGSSISVEVECDICRKKRHVMYWTIRKYGHTNCQKCTVAKHNEKVLNIGDKYPKLTVIGKSKTGYSLFLCDCGNQKTIANYSVTSGKTLSCGCLRRQNKIHHDITGENHPNWKGGISGERDRFMQTSKYKNWRVGVFKRDNYTCGVCGKIGGELEAHHLAPYHSNPNLRLDLDNGVTLCAECHLDFHNNYGRVKFTPEDYHEYRRD